VKVVDLNTKVPTERTGRFCNSVCAHKYAGAHVTRNAFSEFGRDVGGTQNRVSISQLED
jgi:hypothetical protein